MLLKKLISLGVEPGTKQSLQQQTELLNRIAWVGLLAVGFTFTLNVARGSFSSLAVDGPVLLLLTLILLFNYFKKALYSRFLAVVGFSLIFLSGNVLSKVWMDGPLRVNLFFADHFFLVLSAVFPVILLDPKDEKKAFWAASIFGFSCFAAFDSINSYFGFSIIEAAGDAYFTKELQFSGIIRTVAWLALFFGVFYLKKINSDVEANLVKQNDVVSKQEKKLTGLSEKSQIHNEELRQQSEELQAQHDFIDDQNKNLKSAHHSLVQSIRTARHIQQAILPDRKEMGVLGEYFVFFKPCDMVSGDCYWIHSTPDEILLAGIDCTGHGIPGAFMTLIADTELSKIVALEGINEPSEVLEELRLNLHLILKQEQTKNADGMDIGVVKIEPAEQDVLLTFSGAKFSLYFYEAGRPEIGQLKGNRINIGGKIKKNKFFSQEEVLLPAGSFAYIGSDGIRDQNNENGEKFGSQRLLGLLSKIWTKPADYQEQTIEKSVTEFMKQSPQRDDMLLIGFRIDPKIFFQN